MPPPALEEIRARRARHREVVGVASRDGHDDGRGAVVSKVAQRIVQRVSMTGAIDALTGGIDTQPFIGRENGRDSRNRCGTLIEAA